MKRFILLTVLLISAMIYSNAQIYIDNQGNIYDESLPAPEVPQPKKFDKSKLEYGGDLSFAFGNNKWGLGLSPQVGYRFSDYFSAGAGIGYRYYSDKWGGYYNLKEHFASFNLYATLYPVKYLVFSVRPEIGRIWQNYEIDGFKSSGSKFVPSVVVGGGVRFGPATIQLKYDLVQDKYSPYGDTIFYAVGFTF